ncbi:MAG: copper resistance protein NlpE N-terminal domain-containing protein [Neisseria sp.]|nr:copper resistance protein NlpE N-terminal domain-containing protein [Neisseria sp.]
MKLHYASIALLAVALAACGHTEKAGQQHEAAVSAAVSEQQAASADAMFADEAHSAENALDWMGVYKGVLGEQICAENKNGCLDFAVELTLNSDGTYRWLQAPSGGRTGQQTRIEGRFQWEKGGSVIALQQRPGALPYRFFVAEGHLQPLNEGEKTYRADNAAYRLEQVERF